MIIKQFENKQFKNTLKAILFSSAIITSGYLFHIDNSTIVKGQLVEQNKTDQTTKIETVENEQTKNKVETITEEFKITSLENGILKGELVNGTGEGIYYNLNDKQLEKYPAFYNVDVNDFLMIEWTKENYNNEEWLSIEKALYNKNDNNKNATASIAGDK